MKAVILAGGGGTRLWPLSTPERPKQFHALTSEKTMLEETIDRLDFLAPEDIYLAINEKHLALTRQLAPQIPEKNIIIEPALRDTASCIGYAAQIIETRHPGEVMAVIYADHLIKNKANFQKYLKTAAQLAAAEHTLNIVEVPASKPETGYGYVKLGEKLDDLDDTEIYAIDTFTEKPDLELAKEFIASGDYLWNTGIYVWEAKTLLDAYAKHQPETHTKLQEMDSEKKVSEIYPTLEKISIDYAIMEKVDPRQIRIIKAENLGWSDIGNWEALFQELADSADSNLTQGPIKHLDTHGSLIYSQEDKPVKILGIDDLVVVNSPDGLLITKKFRSKDLKKLDQ